VARTCGACNGAGSCHLDPCPHAVAKRAATEIKLNVKSLRRRRRYAYPLLREGDAGRAGGPKGDLYVVLSIRSHDFFERHGTTLLRHSISFPQPRSKKIVRPYGEDYVEIAFRSAGTSGIAFAE